MFARSSSLKQTVYYFPLITKSTKSFDQFKIDIFSDQSLKYDLNKNI